MSLISNTSSMSRVIAALGLTGAMLLISACNQANKEGASNTSNNPTVAISEDNKHIQTQTDSDPSTSKEPGLVEKKTKLENQADKESQTATGDLEAGPKSGESQEEALGVSQQVEADDEIGSTLNKVLPAIEYTTATLPAAAQKVNQATWYPDSSIDQNIGTKIQALLNWHHHSVGAVDGKWGKNTRKAMQAFQRAKGLEVSDNMNHQTWQALSQPSDLAAQPVLVSYTLSSDDINLPTVTIPNDTKAKDELEGMYYERVTEALAEKFHMDEDYLIALNPDATFNIGETITVYNPGNPSTKAVHRVVADKATETLYAYDTKGSLVASYPTTVGSSATPSPNGTHKVKLKVYEPNYTYSHDDGSQTIIPPGANNPVGLVWIGLSKPTYGIHGSPDPERISRQASSGCVRLTNWDALALYGTIDQEATVEFK